MLRDAVIAVHVIAHIYHIMSYHIITLRQLFIFPCTLKNHTAAQELLSLSLPDPAMFHLARSHPHQAQPQASRAWLLLWPLEQRSPCISAVLEWHACQSWYSCPQSSRVAAVAGVAAVLTVWDLIETVMGRHPHLLWSVEVHWRKFGQVTLLVVLMLVLFDVLRLVCWQSLLARRRPLRDRRRGSCYCRFLRRSWLY